LKNTEQYQFYVHSTSDHWVNVAFTALMLLVRRQEGIRPVKNWVVGCWRGYLSGVRCRFAYAQLMPLPLTISCYSKSRLALPSWFYLSRTSSSG